MPTGQPLEWAQWPARRHPGELLHTHNAYYRLSEVVQRGGLDESAAGKLLLDSGLVEMVWQMTWADETATPDYDLPARFDQCEGFVVLIHGWTGNHTIWEEIPEMLVSANPKLVCLAMDHNGFGEARFADDTPTLDECNPPSAMLTVERLVEVLRLRRQPGDPDVRVINFVGHSMGGAALFYLNPMRYEIGEETRYAIAPALLLNDSTNRVFYNALGLGIGIVNRLRIFEPIEELIKPGMINTVCEGSSRFVQRVHDRQYDQTPRGITSATFRAMGRLQNWEIARRWDLFRVMLGHKDSLVGLVHMMDLLSTLEVPAEHVRVVAGSHYMFSVGIESAWQHAQNRELVIKDVLRLHERAITRLRGG
jgi:pimeloyl-ACP methyl ester carboxylesterase